MGSPMESDNEMWHQGGHETPSIHFHPADYSLLDPVISPTADAKRKRVGFTQDITPQFYDDTASSSLQAQNEEAIESPEALAPPNSILPNPLHSKTASISDTLSLGLTRNDISDAELSKSVHAFFGQPYVPKPKPAIRKVARTPDVDAADAGDTELDGEGRQKFRSGIEAHDRAQRLALSVGSYNASAAGSRRNSIELEEYDSAEQPVPLSSWKQTPQSGESIPEKDEAKDLYLKARARPRSMSNAEANRLVRSYTQGHRRHYDVETPPLPSGQITPVAERSHAEDYVPQPQKYRGGIHSSLMKLLAHQGNAPLSARQSGDGYGHSFDGVSLAGTTPSQTPEHSPPTSGTTTPIRKQKFLHRHRRHGTESPNHIANHLFASTSTLFLPQTESSRLNNEKGKQAKQQQPGLGKRTRSNEAFATLKKLGRPHFGETARITQHIAEILSRRKYLVKLCRALMEYGAPTHRLEEYMKASSRVLEIEVQFLYIPGCMIISFDDSESHTAEVKLVRTAQGVDLGKLRDTHRIYKQVVHDRISVDEAIEDLDEVVNQPKKFNRWFLVFVYGLASVSVGPFAFQARLIDLPMCFILGCVLGFLQLILAPVSDLYANIFEIAASVLTSFAARGLGSIPNGKGGTVFCFSALSQSSIALILPGYTVLCASLELQSRSIVAGSVRMVYAIIYSLFLGYGITIGTVLYGFIDKNATSETSCSNPMPDYWFFFFVPAFTMCLIIINQAKWKQAPVMLVISFAGYLVNFFSSRRFRGNTQVSQTLGALCIGILANLYARLGLRVDNFFLRLWKRWGPKTESLYIGANTKIQDVENPTQYSKSSINNSRSDGTEQGGRVRHKEKIGYGMAAAAMLPAIFVQVPSGLAVSGSLVAGLTSANQIIKNTTGSTTVSSGSDTSAVNSAAFNVGYSVIQVAIGITVGLFLSAILVYPFGKRRSGLFSF